ncbi:PREDICTED: uncharacterized protein LOC108562057 [Nicrophorus vespilloides]|uniref:PCNA-associated factor n=1 Tax=Nicrophorus vespilloides TaxID=110193 RepID=A0ABM1MMD5_NICVS|nr:PREDICTED: uncharacterized protein LOC108562057 [Nicrophorus vespilloides]
MVRTAATSIKVGAKASKGGGGASRASTIRSSSSSGGASRRAIGGNKLVSRPTPTWQKPITKFFAGGDKIAPPSKLEYTEQVCEEEVITLEPPHWQTSVSNFLVKQSDIISKEDITSSSPNIDEVQLDAIVPSPAYIEEKAKKMLTVKPSKEMEKPEQVKSKIEKPSMEDQVQAGPSSSLRRYVEQCNTYPPYPEMDNNNYMHNQNYPPPNEIHVRQHLNEGNQEDCDPEMFENNENDAYMENQNYLPTHQEIEYHKNGNVENIPSDCETEICENKENEYMPEAEHLNPPKKRRFAGYKYLENYECPNQK